MIERFRERFQISEEEALVIRQVTEQKVADPSIRVTVLANHGNTIFLQDHYRRQVNESIRGSYFELARLDELTDEKYIEEGAIFDIMAATVIAHHLPAMVN